MRVDKKVNPVVHHRDAALQVPMGELDNPDIHKDKGEIRRGAKKDSLDL